MKISNSKANTFLNCRQQYQYKHIRGLQAKVKGRPLMFGDWMHQLLEAHFSGQDWRKVHKRLSKAFDGLFDEEKDMLGNLPVECKKKMLAYLFNYRDEDRDLEVLSTELIVEVPLLHGHTMTGKIDLVTLDELGLWIWEHKFQDRFPNSTDRFVDIQTARYAWAVSQLPQFKEYPLAGIVWDYALRKEPTKPRVTKKGELYKSKIKTDVFTFVSALKEYGLDPYDYREEILRLRKYNDFFKRIRVPVTNRISKVLVRDLIYTADEIERGKWKPIRRIGKHCNWCDYQKLCVTELYGGDAKQVIEANYEPKEGGAHGEEKEEELLK